MRVYQYAYCRLSASIRDYNVVARSVRLAAGLACQASKGYNEYYV